MLLSSARATPDVPSASAVATTNCLLSEYGLRNMACSFEVAAVENGSGARSKASCIEASQALAAMPAMLHEYALPDGVSAVAPEQGTTTSSRTRARIPF
jgi:hypothetical protein